MESATAHHPPAERTAVQGKRLLAPDFARGFTLLGIAGANVATAWVQTPQAPMAGMVGGVYDNSMLDKIAVLLGCVFFHVRGLPMFSTMLGFGIGLIVASLYRRQYPLAKARRVILRRYGFLAIFGLIHCVFLFYGDIMLFYGLAGMLMAALITLNDKTLLWIAGIGLIGNTLLYLILGIIATVASELVPEFGTAMAGSNMSGEAPTTYMDQLITGSVMAGTSPFMFVAEAAMLMPLILIGFVAARRGVLTNPDAYLTQLRWAAGIAVAIMLGCGLPMGLAFIGVLPERWGLPLFLVNAGVGVLTGPGIIAMIVLALRPLQARWNRVQEDKSLSLPLRCVLGLGKRSMSGYLLQSILFTILVTKWGFGFTQDQGAFDSMLAAIGVWVATLVICGGLEIAHLPGPFEWLHRRLSYGKHGLHRQYQP
ncbi:DUF418 domain-containing protein [Staphylococcus chromogenes]|nr:DUF418 domain-containing protein [Staphylococcus chromogenes]